MKLQGLQKLTLLDYPGRVACTVFTSGCNFRCLFCHNASLLDTQSGEGALTEAAFFEYLNRRRTMLEGVCVTGGEPTLQRDLPAFLARIHECGLSVKLDTNGSNPALLRRLIEEGLVDYVAMDLKNAPEGYAHTSGNASCLGAVTESAALLRESAVPHEFRTTVVSELHDEAAIRGIGQAFGGESPYFLQKFADSGDIVAAGLHAPSDEEMRRYLQAARAYFPRAALRGME